MKYVPSLPPPVSGIEDWRAKRALSAVRPAKPVQARTLPPLVIQPHHSPQEKPAEAVQEVERREPEHESRRKICRRISHQPMLEELRSGVDRRRTPQRGGDEAEHIDEKA